MQIAPHAAENVARHVVQWKHSHYPHVRRFIERHASKNVHSLARLQHQQYMDCTFTIISHLVHNVNEISTFNGYQCMN